MRYGTLISHLTCVHRVPVNWGLVPREHGKSMHFVFSDNQSSRSRHSCRQVMNSERHASTGRRQLVGQRSMPCWAVRPYSILPLGGKSEQIGLKVGHGRSEHLAWAQFRKIAMLGPTISH